MQRLRAGEVAYYTDPVARGWEAPGRWVGRGSGLVVEDAGGDVDPRALAQLTRGRRPDGAPLAAGPRTLGGWDVTFSAPKSLSVVWAASPDGDARRIEQAVNASVDAAAGYLESNALWARAGRAEAMVAAAFRHGTSRAGDPHLHDHLVVANLAPVDGRWYAAEGHTLAVHLHTAGTVFHAQLRHETTTSLGLSWHRSPGGYWQIEGVDEALRRSFSRRRQQVEEVLAAHGGRRPQAARLAALVDRPPRDGRTTVEACRPGWARQCAEAGFDPVALPRSTAAERTTVDADVARRAMEAVADRSSFGRREMLAAVCDASAGGLSADRAARIADELVTSGAVVTLTAAIPRRSDRIRVGKNLVPTGHDPGVMTTRTEARAVADLHRLASELAGERSAGGAQRLSALSGRPGPQLWAEVADLARGWPTTSGVVGLAAGPEQAAEMRSLTGLSCRAWGPVPPRRWDGLIPRGALVVAAGGESMPATVGLGMLEAVRSAGATLVLVADDGAVPTVDRGGTWRAVTGVVACRRLSRDAAVERGGVHPVLDGRDVPAVRLPGLVLVASPGELTSRMAADWCDAPAGTVLTARRRSDAAQLEQAARRLAARRGLPAPEAAVGLTVLGSRDAPGALVLGDPGLYGEVRLPPSTFYAVADMSRLEPRRPGAEERADLASLPLDQLAALLAEERSCPPAPPAPAAGRAVWVADHATALSRRASILQAVAVRRQNLGRVAELAPPAVVTGLLGARPADAGAARVWAEAAGGILAYRERWRVTGPDLFSGPATGAMRAERDDLRRCLQRVLRSQALERHVGLGGPTLGTPGPELGR